jgi:hypothetical protein
MLRGKALEEAYFRKISTIQFGEHVTLNAFAGGFECNRIRA